MPTRLDINPIDFFRPRIPWWGGRSSIHPAPSEHERSAALARRLEGLAWLMDRAVTIPGTRISLGLDALLGLLPIGGDVITGLIQAGLVLVALSHYRVPKHVAMRMAANVLLDIVIGAIPVLGDLFDVAFKANTRNLRLLERYRRTAEAAGGGLEVPSSAVLPRPRGIPRLWLVAIGLVLVAVLGLMLLGFVTLIRWFITNGPGLF